MTSQYNQTQYILSSRLDFVRIIFIREIFHRRKPFQISAATEDCDHLCDQRYKETYLRSLLKLV